MPGGDNASCSGGGCECDEGHDDPNGDGDCTAECPEDLNAAMDDVAKASLGKIPREPWEQAESYSCSGGAVVAGHRRSSESNYVKKTEEEWWKKRQAEDKDLCSIAASFADGAGHSHPHFKWPRDDRVRCLGTIMHDRDDVRDQNRANKDFSGNDRQQARSVDKPFYLVVPERNRVKVYRKNDAGNWRVEWWRI